MFKCHFVPFGKREMELQRGTFGSLVFATAMMSGVLINTVQGVGWDVWTELDDYVNRPNPYYNWKLIQTYDYPDYTLNILNLTSQKWMNESFTPDSIWKHYLSIFIPKNLTIRDAGYLFTDEGTKYDPPPSPLIDRMQRTAKFCLATGAVSALLLEVPIQPTTVQGNSAGLLEDDLLAYTWVKYIVDPNNPPNPDVILLLPMVKAAKTALDAMTEFAKSQDPTIQLTKFMPAGMSKRGWLTWLLGCADKRVFAMVPICFDLLNTPSNLEHIYRSFGGWPFAFEPYWNQGLPQYLYHPRNYNLSKFMDPLSFNERLTMPKLIPTASGDDLFVVDDSTFFISNITQPAYLQIWENDDHGTYLHLNQLDNNMEAFFLNAYRGLQFPQFSWTKAQTALSGTITVTTSTPPLSIVSWWADTNLATTCEPLRNNTCRRDFRLSTGMAWIQGTVNQIGLNTYSATYQKRRDLGYRIFYIALTFQGPGSYVFQFTTDVLVIPDTYPYPKCTTPAQCQGQLIA